MSEPVRIVLDTNVLISALLFRNGRLRNLRLVWQAGHVQPVVSTATSAELLRVLNYKKFKLDSGDVQEALALYIPYVATHSIDSHANAFLGHVPFCSDPKDQMFLDLAQTANVEYLISGDEDLLRMDDPLCKHLTFRIISPRALLEKLSPNRALSQ